MFTKAERKRSKLRLALAGPSGSGKTMSALRIAKGMAAKLGCKVCVLDTEKESSNLYADVMEFDVLGFNPPFPPSKYVSGIKLAEKEGYGICIIDSISHEWNGEGGCLSIVDKLCQADAKKNSYVAWNKVTPMHNEFIDAILQSNMHIIVTVRSKVAYEMVKNDRTGKTAPVKIGLAPITREGMDFEFTTWFDVSIDGHLCTASKDRTRLFDTGEGDPMPILVTEETGELLVSWLEGSKA